MTCKYCDCHPLTLGDFEMQDNFLPKGSTSVRIKEVSPYYVVPDCGTLTFSGKDKNTGCTADYVPDWVVIDSVTHNPLGFAEVTFHRISGLNCDETNQGGTQYDHYDSEIISVNDNHTDYGKNPWWDCQLCECLVTSDCNLVIFSEPERCFDINTAGTPTASSEGGLYNVWHLTDSVPAFYPPFDAPTGKKWVAHVTIYGAFFSQYSTGADFDQPSRWYIALNQNGGVLGTPNGDVEQSNNYAPGDHADSDLSMSGWYDNGGTGYSTTTPFSGSVRMEVDMRTGGSLFRNFTTCYIFNLAYHLICE